MNGQYEVLGPWAEAEAVALKGISPRVTDLAGKTIGLFSNLKPTAQPILTAVEQKLKVEFPTAKFSWYASMFTGEIEHGDSEKKAELEAWLKGVDAVVGAIGD